MPHPSPLEVVRAYLRIVEAAAPPTPLPLAAVPPAARAALYGAGRLEAWGVPPAT